MTIKNSIIEFERLYHKIKNYDMGLPDGVLAYKFLNNANISEHHKQLVRATLSELKYSTMEEQLKKVFSDPSNFTGSIKEEQNIKVESVSNTDDLHYGYRYSKRYNPRYRGNNRCNTNNKDSGSQSSHLIKVNPCNKDGCFRFRMYKNSL